MQLNTLDDVIQFYASQQYHEFCARQLITQRLMVCCIASALWTLLAFNLLQPVEVNGYYDNAVTFLTVCFVVMMAGSLHFILRAFCLPKFKMMPVSLKGAPEKDGKVDVARYFQSVPDYNRAINHMKSHMVDRSGHWLIGSYLPVLLILLINYID